MSIYEPDNDVEFDEGYDLSSSKHVTDIHKEATECMSHFFIDKSFWAGGAIPDSKLYQKEHVKTVAEFNVMDSLVIAYYCLERNKPDTINTKEKGWDVKLCYECLNQCASRFIPKCHAGGILLVYLAICHGVDYLPTLKLLKEIKKTLAEKERQEELSAPGLQVVATLSVVENEREDELQKLLEEQKQDDEQWTLTS